MVLRVDLGAADKEDAHHAVHPDERDGQVRGRGPERNERSMRLVGQHGHEPPQDPGHPIALIGGVRLNDESRAADGRHIEEPAAVIRHDTAEQPKRVPEPVL